MSFQNNLDFQQKGALLQEYFVYFKKAQRIYDTKFLQSAVDAIVRCFRNILCFWKCTLTASRASVAKILVEKSPDPSSSQSPLCSILVWS